MASRKGQAAMEYLMTYGWALVLLVAVIAALMATGAFNPSYLVAEECTLQPDLSCGSHILYVDGSDTIFLMRLDNGLGYDIYVKEAKVFLPGDDTGISTPDAGETLEQGSNITMGFTLSPEIQPSRGELERMRLVITYVSCAPEVNPDCLTSGPEHTISGRVVARVEEKA